MTDLEDAQRYLAAHTQWLADHPRRRVPPAMAERQAEAQRIVAQEPPATEQPRVFDNGNYWPPGKNDYDMSAI